jgi:DNA-directed RNA polymerase specialized sigma24 family protein
MEQSAERECIGLAGMVAGGGEVASALRQLSATDLLRLEALARLRARGLPPSLSWSDLLHEAIRRALDGSRPWPPGVPLLAFLAGIMRSVRSELCRRGAYEVRLMRTDLPYFCGPLRDERDPERIVAAARAVAGIYALFAGDEAALQVISALANGLTASEIRRTLGMSETEYETTRKRMRRTLLRQGFKGREP